MQARKIMGDAYCNRLSIIFMHSRSGIFSGIMIQMHIKLPYGNLLELIMIQTTEHLGRFIRQTRHHLGITQKDLALTAGTGLRFIIELENGKSTCQIGKILQVLQVLGIQINLTHTELKHDQS